MSIIGSNVEKAGLLLNDGQLVAIPTETVYGLAANALDIQAVAGIFAAKNRPTFDPLIVHVKSLDAVAEYVTEIPEKARELAEAFWPGPLTLLLPKKSIIPELVTSGLPTVAVRVPRHPLTLALLQSLEFPLAAPSANPFGYISPTTAQHVEQQLGSKIAYILDGGECRVGIESTIVSFESSTPKVLRLGGLRLEDIESKIGKVEKSLHSSSNPLAPGMLKSHYAPQKPLFLCTKAEMTEPGNDKNVGYLFFDKGHERIEGENCLYLSETGDFLEAAQHLFDYLRKLDASHVQEIRAEILPEKDLGRAINDRLRRAAAV
ncbi:L-threonylcarbamoyladenylate synthase [Persicitalea jodogahamensis]|uniref:L-threonylcarbamoyladenylate synthase n=1 Tax=Persicitalea jodogahamensis TaxID=402147 RepID=UPI001675D24E|nr:L-threonylcarbamoyladenylate synthase [Persicitalea jodogahamensis]